MLNLVAIRNNGLKFKTEISAVRPLNVIAPVSDTPLSGKHLGSVSRFLASVPREYKPHRRVPLSLQGKAQDLTVTRDYVCSDSLSVSNFSPTT